MIQDNSRARRFVTGDADLLGAIPNVIPVCEGETDLYSRTLGFVIESEERLVREVIGEDYVDSLNDGPDCPAFAAARAVVANDALLHALASLNVTLTPNGLATAGTQELVPVSAARTAELRKQLTDCRDLAMDDLKTHLASGADGWAACRQGRAALATVFFRNRDAAVLGITENRMETLHGAEAAIAAAQDYIADRWLSPELIRAAILSEAGVTEEPERRRDSLRKLLRTVQNEVASMIAGKPCDEARMLRTVDRIRRFPGDYREWFDSDTAREFHQPSFRNDRNASGYFFP